MYNIEYLKLSNITTLRDVTIPFVNNKCVLVSGNNLDDSSQKSNGSGKSSWLDALAILLTGRLIRDVNTKDIITLGEDIASIEGLLTNGKETFKIVRKLSAKKAQTCQTFVNGEEHVCSDINGYNAFILNHLDVSADELFSFYLVSSDIYKPFLSCPDSEKKILINKFSGADKLDQVEQSIASDVSAKKLIVTEKEKQVAKNQSVVDQQQYQLDSAVQYDIESEIESIRSKTEEKRILISSLSEKLLESDNVESHYSSLILDEQSILKIHQEGIQNIKEDLRDIEECMEDISKDIKLRENEYHKQIRKIEDEIRNDNNTIKSISLDLSHKVSCPECDHQFITGSDLNIDQAEKQILDLKKQIEKYGKEKTKLTSEFESNLLAVKREFVDCDELKKGQDLIIKESTYKIREIENKISKFESNIKINRNETTSNLKRIEELKDSVETQDTFIENLKNKKKNSIDTCKVNLEKAVSQLNTSEDELKIVESELQYLVNWGLNMKSFKSYLANSSITHIQDYTNHFLNLIDSNLQIEISGFTELSNKKISEKISTTVIRDGKDIGSLGKLSKGERARIELCVILSFQELLNSRKKGLNMLVIDEALNGLDYQGFDSILAALSKVSKTTLLVSQLDLNYTPCFLFEKKQNTTQLIIK